MRYILPLLTVLATLDASGSKAADPPAPDWFKVTGQAAFTPRDSCGELVYHNRMWLLGGWMDSFKDPPRDVWSSDDGKDWTRATAEAAWKHSDFPMTVVFKDKMWVMGGWHGGRQAHASASNAVWSSSDGAEWKQETANAGWSPRMAGGVVTFKDRIWVLGGIQKYYYGNEKDLLNDVWSSPDGVKWEQAVEHTPWSPRAYQGAVVFQNKLWVLAGGNYLLKSEPGKDTSLAYNDVWSSPDGVTWTREVEHAPWPPRIWFSAVVYRDKLWVLGGSSKKPHRNWGDVWYSADGKNWTELKTQNVWQPRHEHSTYVFQDKLWVVTGHAAPLRNDVWRLELPRDWGK